MFVFTTVFNDSAFAESGTNGHDFLKWKQGQQEAFFQSSMAMLAALAGQKSRNFQTCAKDWYGQDPQTKRRSYNEILDYMRKYPDYHPTAIVVATVQRHCGKFKDAKS